MGSEDSAVAVKPLWTVLRRLEFPLGVTVVSFFILLLLTISILMPAVDWPTQPRDYTHMFDGAVRMVLGSDLYHGKKQGWDPFYCYPPTCAALVAPLASTHVNLALSFWSALHPFFAVLLVYFSGLLFGLSTRRQWLALCAISAIALFSPFSQEFVEGQVNVFVTVLVVAGLLLLRRDRVVAGALLLALATHIKVTPGILLLVLLVTRQWRAAGWMCAHGLWLALVPLVWMVPALGPVNGFVHNVDMHVYFVRDIVLTAVFKGQYMDFSMYRWANLSVPGTLHRLFDDNAVVAAGSLSPGAVLFGLPPALLDWVARLVALAMLGGGVFVLRRASSGVAVTGTALLVWLGFQLGNLVCWEHHLLSLVPLFAFLMVMQWPRKEAWILLLAGAMFLVLSLPRLWEMAPLFMLAPVDNEDLVRNGKYGVSTLVVLAFWAVSLYHAWKHAVPTGPAAQGKESVT
ncbi:MAG: DUF2029 domain-containing protein [Planctomycetes bacterium]|nr:DUF2029 domain-containing protein [Planctomycetota bacterium]MCL4730767.1 DUF2029 domain-containing protein [Planctomycetota bacterium]